MASLLSKAPASLPPGSLSLEQSHQRPPYTPSLQAKPFFGCKLSGKNFPAVGHRADQCGTLRNAPRAVAANEGLSSEVTDAISTLKKAASTRKEPASDVVAAITKLEKAKLDASGYLEKVGGAASPGHLWQLIFTSGTKDVQKALKGGLGSGKYFPVTAVQRFDQQASLIENGIYLGPVGMLKFRGPMAMKGKRLAFLFDKLSLKVGPLGPFSFNVGSKKDAGRVPGSGKEGGKDPFFLINYVDDEIVVARGRGGGVAVWKLVEKTP